MPPRQTLDLFETQRAFFDGGALALGVIGLPPLWGWSANLALEGLGTANWWEVRDLNQGFFLLLAWIGFYGVLQAF